MTMHVSTHSVPTSRSHLGGEHSANMPGGCKKIVKLEKEIKQTLTSELENLLIVVS